MLISRFASRSSSTARTRHAWGRSGLLAALIGLVCPAGILLTGAAGASPVRHLPGIGRSSIPSGETRDGGAGNPPDGQSSTQLTSIFSGTTLGLTQPDDITQMGRDLFVGFQNGVGPQGEPSPSGATASAVVELTMHGAVVSTWSLTGHVDGLTADPANHRLIATVNEDGNSSLFTIDPASSDPVQYVYSPSPLPHGGGTDAISILDGLILISASAPNTPPSSIYPAVYSAVIDGATHTATLTPLFSDTATATSANAGPSEGQPTTLGLTDPDSNEVVPPSSPRFPGDFVLDSQGDDEQVYVAHAGSAAQSLSVLKLSSSVNDTAWASAASGTLYITDHTNNLVDALSGHFAPGTAYVAATPCSDNSAPTSCPASGYPANYLGTVDLDTGTVSSVNLNGEFVQPQGLEFVPGDLGFGRG